MITNSFPSLGILVRAEYCYRVFRKRAQLLQQLTWLEVLNFSASSHFFSQWPTNNKEQGKPSENFKIIKFK